MSTVSWFSNQNQIPIFSQYIHGTNALSHRNVVDNRRDIDNILPLYYFFVSYKLLYLQDDEVWNLVASLVVKSDQFHVDSMYY
jgi:hypothetical protein